MTETMRQNVLVVSAEREATAAVLEVLAGRAVHGQVVGDYRAAVGKCQDGSWALVFADLQTLNGRGLEFLRTVKQDSPELPVVMIGPVGAVNPAVRAVREGCEEFLARPVERQAVEAALDRLLPACGQGAARSAEPPGACAIIGKTPALLDTLRQARKAAPSSAAVLITGESGTGKELVCCFVHQHSRRCRGPYVRVNCAALSESLLESELFGHERGAFTGAVCQRKGRFERAHGGTLLLDEISETTPRLQAELLRVLEHQDFERLGGSEAIRVNVRLISTTNRDLAEEVRRGRFRLDLYYRLSGLHLHVPPLRQRRADIPALAWHFVAQYAGEAQRQIADLDAEMMEIFQCCPWPGNVRQLRSAVRTALILGAGPTLSLKDAPRLKAELLHLDSPAQAAPASLKLQELERTAIFEALRRTQRNQAKAARLLGITDRTLREKLRRYRQDGRQDEQDETGEQRWPTATASSSFSRPV